MRNRSLHTTLPATFFLLAALACGTFAGDEPPDRVLTDSETVLQNARERIDAGDHDGAIRILKPAVATYPADPCLPLALADALSRCGRHEVADQLLCTAVEQHSQNDDIRLAWIDSALDRGRHATALDRVKATRLSRSRRAELHYRAARAYFHLDRAIGKAQVRSVPGGKAGQFANRTLLVEPAGGNRFLCCPADSALYQLRLALDAGLNEPAAHALHARIWARIDRPRIGLALLEGRSAVRLETPTNNMLLAYAELARAAKKWDRFLHYERMRSKLAGSQREDVLFNAYRTLAIHYAQAGDATLHRQWLDRAVQLKPDATPTVLELADAEWDGGERDRAATLYRRVLQQVPGHRERGRMMERLAQSATPAPNTPPTPTDP